MTLDEEHIDLIYDDIRNNGVTDDEIAESLLDHICCAIESSDAEDFESAYATAITQFGPEGIPKIQEETIQLLTHKEETMKKTMFVLGYIAAFLSTTGLLFKLQHWPGAAIMLTLGIALLNFGFLPMYFYDRFKRVAE